MVARTFDTAILLLAPTVPSSRPPAADAGKN